MTRRSCTTGRLIHRPLANFRDECGFERWEMSFFVGTLVFPFLPGTRA
ncbi:MAG: hypothetical protein SF187_00735 [Deltaproteobacteria bacterium]|nr:hypothetical protein [Deltaproteobacteria bacterium]